MSVLQILKIISALVTIAVGVPALVKPDSVFGFTGLAISGVRGTSEIRAIFGGLFIGLGLAPLIFQSADAYRMLGIGYLAIAATRLFSILFDQSFSSSNWVSLITEIVLGIILVI